MPTPEGMHWQAERRAWRVQYLGVRRTISCRQLKKLGYLRPEASETKEASIRAANAWLRDFQTKADGARPRMAEHPMQERLDMLQRRLDYARRHGIGPEAEAIKSEMDEARAITPQTVED